MGDVQHELVAGSVLAFSAWIGHVGITPDDEHTTYYRLLWDLGP